MVGRSHGARAAVGLLAALLMLVAPHAAATPLSAPQTAAADQCRDAVDGEAEAAALAATCDQDVEVLDARADADALFAAPDGTFRFERSVSASSSSTEWTVIRAGKKHSSAGYGFTGDQRVGPCVKGERPACARKDTQRIAWEFGGLSELDGISEADVVSATFSADNTRSTQCGAGAIGAYVAPAVDRRTTWSGSADRWGALVGRPLGAPELVCAGERSKTFDVTTAVRSVVVDGGTSISLGLAAVDERCTTCGTARFGADATLSIVINKAPRVDAAWTTMPDTQCVAGAERPTIRSATPQLRARTSDPDGTSTSARFAVHRLADGALVWESPAGVAMPSGSAHAVTVPDTLLVDGQAYAWSVTAVDTAGRESDPVSCELLVDLVPPAAAPTVTPVEGMPAVYREDVLSGRVGLTGAFVFGDGGASGVVSYKYSIDSDAIHLPAAPGEQVAFTPTTAGQHFLMVQSVDAAGWTSPVRTYWFRVGAPVAAVVGSWGLDEGAGLVAADGSGRGNDLALSGEDLWTGGVLAEFAGEATDHGLRFDEATDVATTAGPVVATDGSFWVSAFLRPDVVDGTAAAVSQDGTVVSGFTLGLRRDADCQTASGTCWAFTMADADDVTAPSAVARSQSTVQAGAWSHVVGVHDATSGTVSLYVCELGTVDNPAFPEPVLAATTSFDATWSATGSLRLGAAQREGGSADGFTGTVDQAQVKEGVPTIRDLVRACSGN
jgi:hypothetical protein